METNEPKLSRPVLEHCLRCWNDSRRAAFYECIESIKAYFDGANLPGLEESLGDVCDGLNQVCLCGLYDKDTGKLKDKTLPYRSNWFED